jgi:hypothetical protein
VVIKTSIFSGITQCSLLKVNRRLEGTQPPTSALVSCLDYSLTCSSETSVDFQRTIWHYIAEDKTLQRIARLYFQHNITRKHTGNIINHDGLTPLGYPLDVSDSTVGAPIPQRHLVRYCEFNFEHDVWNIVPETVQISEMLLRLIW